MGEVKHTMESIFGEDSTVESEETDVDPYAGKPADMSTYAWDNLNETTKLQYADPNSEMNRSIDRIEAKATAEENKKHTMESIFGEDNATTNASMSEEEFQEDANKRIQNAITDYEVDPATLFFTTQSGLEVRGTLEDAQGYVRTSEDIDQLDTEIVEAAPEGSVDFLENIPEETGFEDTLKDISEPVRNLLEITLAKDKEEVTKYLDEDNYGNATLSKWLKRPTISTGMGLGMAIPKQVENLKDASSEEVVKNLLYSEDEYISLAKAVNAKLTNENNVRSGLTGLLIDSGLDLHQIAWLTGVAEFAPGTGFFIGAREIPIHARESFKALANGEPWDAAKHGAMAGVETLAAMASTFPAIRVAWDVSIKGLYRMSGFNASKTMKIINANTIKKTKHTKKTAAAARLENKQVNDRLILEYEAKVSKSQNRIIKISKQATDKNGKKLGYLVIDPQLVRAAGLDTTKNMKSFLTERMDAFTKARYTGTETTGSTSGATTDYVGFDVQNILNKRDPSGLEKTKEWKRLRRLETEEGQNVTERLVELRKAWNETDINKIYGGQGEDYLNPLLDSEKFDAIIAVASEMVKRNPEEFGELAKLNLKIKDGKIVRTKGKGTEFKVDPENTLIDQLFNYSVANKLDGYNSEFTDILSKYGLTFDDYVLAVVGSGSEAGKILNKLSQLKRGKNFDVLRNIEESLSRQKGNLGLSIRQIDNIRRGFMVSRIQTTMRNMRSALIRSPLVAMDNVFQAGIYKYGQADTTLGGVKDAVRAINPLSKDGTWKGAFRGLHYMLQEPALAKSISEFTLDSERLGGFDTLTRNANEIRTMSGKADNETSGTIKALTQLSDVLNVPNRLQDKWVAEATYTGEMERLLQLLWKDKITGKPVDYLEELKKGNIDDFLTNSSRLRPAGALPFEEISKLAMDRSLDLTYRLGPQTGLLKFMNQALQKTGALGSAFIPFPKFVFGSMELMADHTGNGVKVLLMRFINRSRGIETDEAARLSQLLSGGREARKGKGIKSKLIGEFQPLTLKQSEQISRNITGIASIMGLMAYRRGHFTNGDVNADYKLVNNPAEIKANQEYSSDASMTNKLQGRLNFESMQFGNAPSGPKEIIKITTDINKNAIIHVRTETGEVLKISTKSPNYEKLKEQGFSVAGAIGVGVEDTTPVFPVRQGLFMAEAVNRWKDGTIDKWYPDKATFYKEAIQTFTGSSFRTGASNVIFDDIFEAVIASQKEDAINAGKGQEMFLNWFGSYTGTYAAIFSQVVDVQMMMGYRDTEAKHVRVQEKIGSSDAKWEAFFRPLRAQGLTTMLPQGVADSWNYGVNNLLEKIKTERSDRDLPPLIKEETEKYIKDLFDADGITITRWNEYPAKQYLYGGGDKINVWKKFMGYTEKTKELDEGEWLTRRGFISWKSGLRTTNVKLKEKVHEHFKNNYLAEIIELGKELEEDALERWSNPNNFLTDDYKTADDYLQSETAELIHTLIRNGILLSKNATLDDMEIKDSDLFNVQERLRKQSRKSKRALLSRYIRRYNKVYDVNSLDDMDDLMGSPEYDPLTNTTKKDSYVGGILQELNEDKKELLDIQEGKSLFD